VKATASAVVLPAVIVEGLVTVKLRAELVDNTLVVGNVKEDWSSDKATAEPESPIARAPPVVALTERVLVWVVLTLALVGLNITPRVHVPLGARLTFLHVSLATVN
jgi:hypothetical protein